MLPATYQHILLVNMASPDPADATSKSTDDGTGTNSNTDTSIALTNPCSNLSSFTDEILLEVLYCISPLEILRHVCRVSKRLAGITSSRDADLRYWRYHPRLPRSVKERIRGENDGNKKKKAATAGSSDNQGREGVNTSSQHIRCGAPSLKLGRRQLQMLVCLCAADDNDVRPRLLRQVDLLPSQETARSTSVEICGGLMLRRRACLASSEDHEHEDVTRILRHARPQKNRDDEVIQRLHGRDARRHEEDSDENGGGGGDTTDDADEDDDERIRQGQAVPRSSANFEPSPSYDAMWEYISREEEDRGPPNMNGHIDLGFFMRVMRQEGTYWSSEPSDSRDTNESLLFAVQGCYYSLITDVAIKPFRELRLDENHVTYTWPKICISVYSLPDVGDDCDYEEDQGSDKDGDSRKTSVWSNGNVAEPPSSAMERQRRQDPFFPSSSGNPIGRNTSEQQRGEHPTTLSSDSSASNPIPAILAGHAPIYTSPPRECDATNTGWQHFKLPPGIVGNVVVITLEGKYHRQFPESGYYVCCERVECRGVPLWSA